LNYFANRSTNASPESFNAKIKAFRFQFRGVSHIKKAFSLYPNATTGIVYLNLTKGNTVHVFNTLGQEVYTSKLNTNQAPFEMNLKHLQSGVYIVKVKDPEVSYTKRLVLE
jgi:hypothetical protein